MLIEIGRTGTEFTQLGQSGQPASVTSVIQSLALALCARLSLLWNKNCTSITCAYCCDTGSYTAQVASVRHGETMGRVHQ